MKSLLATGAFSLMFLVAGCAAAPTAIPGPAGPQGATGDPGAAGRDRDRDADRDREQERARQERERQDQHAACPAGQHERTDNGRTVCVRD
jgi:hypothetical protein